MGLLRLGLAALLLASGLSAQQAPPEPKFDVVSIRPVPSNAPPVMRDIDFTPVLPGGQYVDSRAWLPAMIAFAYDVKMSLQLVGVPKWAENQNFEIAARPAPGFPDLPPGENNEQVRLMMRAMLTDRFHLQLHTENRKGPVFNLEVAKGGIKIKEVDPPVPPAKEGPAFATWSDSYGRLIGNKATMGGPAGLASTLTVIFKQPVIDQTGLKGYYDFDVKWSSPEASDASGFGAEGTALLLSTLQNQFGLRLTKTTGPVEYWVVDHVEPPTDN